MPDRFSTTLKLLALFYAVFALLTGIADGIVGTPTLNDLIFHSLTFHLVLFVSFLSLGWLIAPRLGKLNQ